MQKEEKIVAMHILEAGGHRIAVPVREEDLLGIQRGIQKGKLSGNIVSLEEGKNWGEEECPACVKARSCFAKILGSQ